MGSVIVRLIDEREWWLEWSSVVDAPVTYGMSEEQFIAYYTRSYGTRAGRELPARMERARATGTSMIGETLAELIAYNRAGPRESTLTLAEIIAAYCTGPREEESASSSNDVVSTSPEVVEAARKTDDDSGATAERGLVAPSATTEPSGYPRVDNDRFQRIGADIASALLGRGSVDVEDINALWCELQWRRSREPSDTVSVPRELLVKLRVYVKERRDWGLRNTVDIGRLQAVVFDQDIAHIDRLLEVKRG